MEQISESLKNIADTADLMYIRSMDLSEANIEVHYSNDTRDILCYNGRSEIVQREGVTHNVEMVNCELFILKRKAKRDMTAEAIDTVHAQCKELAQKVYAAVQLNAPMNMEPLIFMPVYEFTDMYEGYKINMIIPTWTNVC